jgi:3',5'-nucleoside bisphosphate phosphatase
MSADLHLHTHFSDGTFSPEELADAALKQSLKIIALTDHDTMEGCPRAQAACEKHGIEFIPGTELTADCDGDEVHILGYWLDPTHTPLRKALDRFQKVRQERIHQMVARLNEVDVPLKVESVLEMARCQAPGRPHVARALVAGGYVRNFDQAFERYLKKGCPAWVPKDKMSATDAVQLIHDAGGVAVLAHPGLYPRQQVIASVAGVGLDGLECWHSKHSRYQTSEYERLAREMGLVPTGGSDCHGRSKGQPIIGTVRIPRINVENLAKLRSPTPLQDVGNQ